MGGSQLPLQFAGLNPDGGAMPECGAKVGSGCLAKALAGGPAVFPHSSALAGQKSRPQG